MKFLLLALLILQHGVWPGMEVKVFNIKLEKKHIKFLNVFSKHHNWIWLWTITWTLNFLSFSSGLPSVFIITAWASGHEPMAGHYHPGFSGRKQNYLNDLNWELRGLQLFRCCSGFYCDLIDESLMCSWNHSDRSATAGKIHHCWSFNHV